MSEGIGTLVIGLNKQWKQEINIGCHNNQTFCHIPHSRFIQMLEYKAQLVGITVIVREESYTSKASFLDLDPIPSYDPKAPRSLSSQADGRHAGCIERGAAGVSRQM